MTTTTTDFASQSRTAQAALLSAVLRRPAILADMEDITPDYFEYQPYQWAWSAVNRLHGRGLTIDQITLGDELADMGKLDEFQYHETNIASAGRAGIAAIRSLAASPEAARSYAARIGEQYAKRKTLQVLTRAAEWVYSDRQSGEILNDVTRQLAEIVPPSASSRTQNMRQAVSAVYDNTLKAASGQTTWIDTGYDDLDAILEGVSGPDVTLIAARPGHGKTAFLASLASNLAEGVEVQGRKRVAFFTLEMSNEQVAMRLLAMESGVSYGKQKKGKLTAEEWEAFNAAVEKIGRVDYPIILNDLPSITPRGIRRELRRMGQVDAVILDYIQLAGTDEKAENRTNEMGKISRAIKLIAKEFNVPVFAAAQLSRETDKRSDKRPILSDLRESGSLEQDADNVILLHRPDELLNVTQVIVAKHRSGPVGFCELVYRPERTRFENAVSRRLDGKP